MYSIVNLRTFSREELLDILSSCAHHLAYAYQETSIDAMQNASYDASDACEYLRCELAAQNKHYCIQ